MGKNFSRRSLLRTGAAAAAVIPFPIWFEKYGAKAGTPMVRHSAQSTQGQAMLAKYRTVVGQMMTQPKGNPCSWTFQWYTHAVPTNTTKAAEVAALPAAQRPLANEMWNTCQAHTSTSGAVEDYFLPWHRMYVYFFERMVRTLSGDPSFTLPYWDYTQTSQRAIPSEFRNPANTSNALYRSARNNGGVPGNANVNGGQPIDYGLSPSPIDVDFASAVAEAGYSQTATHDGFCMNLDQNLHGDIHVLTGNSVGMGRVPWAANDPVFWLHHCNIDRIWASWNLAGRANPTSSSWLNKTFTFADEHCNRVVGTINDFKAIGPLNYAYESYVRVPATRHLLLGNLQYLAVLEQIHLPNPPDPYHIALPLSEEVRKRPLVSRLKSLNGGEVRLVLRDLAAKASPDVIYAVYVGLPPGTREIPKGARPVGFINFFDATAMPGMEMNKESLHKFVSFDVTEALGRANLTGKESTLNVTIVPAGKANAEAAPSIGRIELVSTGG